MSGLIPADGFIFQAAHISRAVVLADWIDPSVLKENDPDKRDPALDLYNPEIKPPYSAEFLLAFRAAQLARIRRRTDWVKQVLQDLRKKGGAWRWSAALSRTAPELSRVSGRND